MCSTARAKHGAVYVIECRAVSVLSYRAANAMKGNAVRSMLICDAVSEHGKRQ